MIEIKLPLSSPPLRSAADYAHEIIASNVDIWCGLIIAAVFCGGLLTVIVHFATRRPASVKGEPDWDHEPVGDVGPYQGWVR